MQKINYKKLLNKGTLLLQWIGIELIIYYWIEENVDRTLFAEIKNNRKDCSFEFLTERDMRVIGNISERTSPWLQEEKLIDKLHKGLKCFGVKCGGEIAAFSWINLNEVTYPHHKMKLKKNEAYLFDIYTFPKFRRKNLATYLRKEIYSYLLRKGRNKLYSVSNYFNTPSIQFKKKLNAKFVYLGIYVRFLKKYDKKWIFYKH